MKHTTRVLRLSLIVAASALLLLTPMSAKPPRVKFGRPHVTSAVGKAEVLKSVKVVNFGRVIYRGKMDVNPTLDRIRQGKRLSHRNDGAYFQNRERRLPRRVDRQYYREFVHKMAKFPYPGPQRLIIGKRGEVYYTGDHYKSFVRVHLIRDKK